MDIDKEQKWRIMQEAVKPILTILEQRLSQRLDTVEALNASPLDNIPEIIRLKREEEAAKNRAVIQEQRDLIGLIKVLFPDGEGK